MADSDAILEIRVFFTLDVVHSNQDITTAGRVAHRMALLGGAPLGDSAPYGDLCSDGRRPHVSL